MTRLSVNDARCEALFASGLQRSDTFTPEGLTAVISRTVRQFGIAGCAGRMAQEFGDHPEAAAIRMRWIRKVIGEIFAPPTSWPVRLGGWPPIPTSSPTTPASSPTIATCIVGSGVRVMQPAASNAHRAA